ncbi:MAG: M28 family peptidase [Prevotellaceae bacterium]|jgi:hypothetical protein|nr:M28 family peptidase [Prevotellaceae bacterium]
MEQLCKKTNIAVLCGSIAIALVLSIIMLSSPKPKEKDDWFSAVKAWNHLQATAKHRHSVFELEQIEEVRCYIQETIDSYESVQWARVQHPQIEVKNQKTDTKEWIDIHNIYAEIPGTSGASMLLMAHYDSSPYKEKYGVGTDGSFGAADDGYGIATMLEIVRLMNDYAATYPLVNGIKFAFTDAEEVALGGADALVNKFSYWLKGVNVVMNLEARGNKGPLYMFQTSDNNLKLIDFYSRTHLPFAFSIAAEVYKRLPNDTDFTPFLQGGFSGLNFATLNSLKYYHTPEDNLDNADLATLQFYGEQLFPLVKEYAISERYSGNDSFVSNSNAVFFTLLPGLLVHYSQQVSWIILLLAALSFAVIVCIAIRKKSISLSKALLSFGLWTAYLLVSAVVGFLLAKFIGYITGNRFSLMNMPYVPFDLGFVIIFAAIVIVLGFFVANRCKKIKCRSSDTIVGASLLFTLLGILFAFLLHGGTYLFVWPAIFFMGILDIHIFNPLQKRRQWIWKYTLQAFSTIVVSIMYIALIYSLFLALTFGALAVVLLFTALWGCALVVINIKILK